MALRNVRIEVAYDGSLFYGWQRQDGFDSVQASIEDGLADLLGTIVTIHGAGRTDTGVHALRQVAHFHLDTRLDDDRLRHALNAHLPAGVRIRRAETCRDDFHARFDARGKRYAYVVQSTRHRPALGVEHVHWQPAPLNRGAMADLRLRQRVLVDVSEQTQLKRTIARDQNNAEQVKAIMAAQLDRQQKLARADDIIDNNGSLAQLTEQIAHLHKKYLELSREIRNKEQ